MSDLPPSSQRQVRVIVFGNPGQRWKAAFGPRAPVWARLPEVAEVLFVTDVSDAVIPPPGRPGLGDVIIPLFEHHISACPTGLPSLTPSAQALKTFSNKVRFADYVERHGLSGLCPPTWRDEADASFPCVLKSAKLSSGRGVAVVASAAELRERLEQDPWKGRDYLLQALAGGTHEYVTHCICRDGRVQWSSSFAYELDEADLIRGEANFRTPRPWRAAPGVLAQIARLLEPSGFTGPCNVDYKIAEDGKIVVFEINPRLGGSLVEPEHVDQLRQALACIIENAAQAGGSTA